MNLDWRHGSCSAAAVLAEKSGFAQIAGFAEDGTATQHLQRALPGRCIRASRVVNVWHVPGVRFDVVYRLDTGDVSPLLAAVRFFNRSASRAAAPTTRISTPRPDRIFLLAEWDAMGWLFPFDPAMPALQDLCEQRVQLAPSADVDVEYAGFVGCTPLSYQPERRCAVLIRGPGCGAGIVAKIANRAGSAHARLSALWHDPSRRFAMAEPLEEDARIGARWERYVDGVRLEAALRGKDHRHIIALVSAAAVALHTQPARPDLPHQAPARVLARINRKVRPRMDRMLPHLSSRAAALSHSLADHMDALADWPGSTLHGDLHTANLLIQGDRAVFIDLDEIARGDPAYDLALLGSRLILAGLIGALPSVPYGRLVAELPEAYAAQGGNPIPARTFAWYMAALLVGRQIKACIRNLAPQLPELAETLLTTAEATLARGRFNGALGSR